MQSVPHHQIFQFTVHPDGSITRKDIHMDLVRDPAHPHTRLPGWPFDVSHSRPLTAADMARYSSKPLGPLPSDRVASLSDVPPVRSAAADCCSRGVPPPALAPVLPDPDTCQALAASGGAAGGAGAPRAEQPAAASETHPDAHAPRSQTSRLRTALSAKAGRAALRSPRAQSAACMPGMHDSKRLLLPCKSQNAAGQNEAPALGRAPGGRGTHTGEAPARLHSAPGDLLTFLDDFGQASQPATLDELAANSPGAAAQGSGEQPSDPDAADAASRQHALRGRSPEGRAQPQCSTAPTAPMLCSIPEKCWSLRLQSQSQSQSYAVSGEGTMDGLPVPLVRSQYNCSISLMHFGSGSTTTLCDGSFVASNEEVE